MFENGLVSLFQVNTVLITTALHGTKFSSI